MFAQDWLYCGQDGRVCTREACSRRLHNQLPLSASAPSTLRFDEITEDYAELIAATLNSQLRNKRRFRSQIVRLWDPGHSLQYSWYSSCSCLWNLWSSDSIFRPFFPRKLHQERTERRGARLDLCWTCAASRSEHVNWTWSACTRSYGILWNPMESCGIVRQIDRWKQIYNKYKSMRATQWSRRSWISSRPTPPRCASKFSSKLCSLLGGRQRCESNSAGEMLWNVDINIMLTSTYINILQCCAFWHDPSLHRVPHDPHVLFIGVQVAHLQRCQNTQEAQSTSWGKPSKGSQPRSYPVIILGNVQGGSTIWRLV